MSTNNVVTVLNNKADKSLGNLSTKISAEDISNLSDAILNNMFTIIYPFGTEQSPGTITINTTYRIPNPFPGYYVDAQVEIYSSALGEWGVAEMSAYYSSAYYGQGMYIYQHNDDELVLKTGKNYLAVSNTASQYYIWANSFTSLSANITTATPFRVKVWKIGKIKT